MLAAGLIGAIGTASVIGRLALGALAVPLGLLRVFRGCFLAIALSFVLWWVAGGSYPVLLAFALVLGVGYGGYVALAPAVVAARFGVERLGALLGVLYTSAAVGSAVGPPAAGAIIDAGGYGPAIAASLAIGLAASRGRGARDLGPRHVLQPHAALRDELAVLARDVAVPELAGPPLVDRHGSHVEAPLAVRAQEVRGLERPTANCPAASTATEAPMLHAVSIAAA